MADEVAESYGKPQCHVCGKLFKDRRGLCGHLWQKHKIKASECPEFQNGREPAVRSGKLLEIMKLQDEIEDLAVRSERCRDWVVKGLVSCNSKDTERLKSLIQAEIERKKLMMRGLLDEAEASDDKALLEAVKEIPLTEGQAEGKNEVASVLMPLVGLAAGIKLLG